MPIYEYQAADGTRGCGRCREPFEVFGKAADPPLAACPGCGAPVRRLISTCAVGSSRSGLAARAKSAGFHKLERRDRGVYEKAF